MVVTLGIWVLYATVLVLRREARLHGRRAAWLLLAGFALVAVVLPITHFAS
jgi:ABC-type transport system involved in cytochrome c biogenesis permease subunit